MSDGIVRVNVGVLRGWARTWDGLAQQLTAAQKALGTELGTLQLEFMSSGVDALDRASGELSRSGTYSTRVANAVELADGDLASVDYTRFDTKAFGRHVDANGQPRVRGGALSDAADSAASRFINRPEHDPRVDPEPPAEQAPNRTEVDPRWTPSTPSAPGPRSAPPHVQTNPAQGSDVPRDWSAALGPVAPVLVSGGRTDWAVQPVGDLIPGVVASPDGSIPFGDDGIAGPILPDWAVGLPQEPTVPVGEAPDDALPFGDDGIAGPVLGVVTDPDKSVPFGEDGIAAGVLPEPFAPRVTRTPPVYAPDVGAVQPPNRDWADALSPVAPVLAHRSEPELVGPPACDDWS